MTKKEIAKVLGYAEEYIHKYFRLAGKDYPNIAAKNNHSTVMNTVDYTLEECVAALSYGKFTKAQVQVMKDNFVYREGGYLRRKKKIKLSADPTRFIYFYKKYRSKFRVCNTCLYCVGRTPNKAGSGFAPYCTFYERFLNKTHLNVYRDRCKTWTRRRSYPVIWGKNLPQNEGFGGWIKKETLGIKNSEIMAPKKRKPDEPIVLLNQF